MYMTKKRRGRPHQNRPTIDLGTKELQHKRRTVVHGDPALAESLLGVLYGRQLISQPLYEAGRFFGELGYRYEPCLGHQFRQNSSVFTHKIIESKGINPLQWSETQDEKRTRAWYNALVALKQAGEGPYRVVLNVVFYDPVYDYDLYETSFPKSILPFVPPLQKGLTSLETYFKVGLKGGRGRRLGRGQNLVRSTRFQQPLKERRFCFPP